MILRFHKATTSSYLTMKLFIVAALLVVAVSAYKSQSGASSVYGGGSMMNGAADAMAFGSKLPPVAILSYVNEAKEDGSFHYSFESADGIKVETSGSQKKVGPKAEDVGTVSKGSYSYTAPDGTPITVNWVADENGFQPTGNHLPTPPPMPEHVVKMLADIKKKQQAEAAAASIYRPATSNNNNKAY